MKERLGFVSNSSSSSFTCDTCREAFSGWDASPQDFDHERCEKGHIFCQSQMVNRKRFDFLVDLYYDGCDLIPDDLGYGAMAEPENYNRYGIDEDRQYEVPAEFCPVCQMKEISPGELNSYIYRIYNIDKKELMDEIRQKFETHEEFVRFING
jgi:hypothetical protein